MDDGGHVFRAAGPLAPDQAEQVLLEHLHFTALDALWIRDNAADFDRPGR